MNSLSGFRQEMFRAKQRRRSLKRMLLFLAAVLVFCHTVLFNPNPANLNSRFDLIRIPTNSASGSTLFLAVFVISFSSNFQARHTIRKTWANAKIKSEAQWAVVFVLGKPSDQETQRKIQEEADENNDILQGDFIDNKRNLVLKTIMMIQWSSNARFEYILKTDDDMYVHVSRTTRWLRSQHNVTLYAGKTRENGIVIRFRLVPYSVAYEEFPQSRYPQYCRGGFYLLSGNVLPKLLEAHENLKLFPVEDAYMGVLARYIGMSLTNLYPKYLMLERNFQWMDLDYTECKFSDVFALGDSIDPRSMLYIHNLLKMLESEKQSGRFRCKN